MNFIKNPDFIFDVNKTVSIHIKLMMMIIMSIWEYHDNNDDDDDDDDGDEDDDDDGDDIPLRWQPIPAFLW